MKKLVLISLLVIGCSSNLTSQKVYENILYCKSTLTLYDNGRADWYDCEIEETYYGHYWQQSDTLFIETFCTSDCHEDHRCFFPRIDISILRSDSIVNIGFMEARSNEQLYSDTICYLASPHVYIITK